jgi:hypothetical protein
MDELMNQGRIKALSWGATFGVFLGLVSIAAITNYPNTILEGIGSLIVAPVTYYFEWSWQCAVLLAAYLGVFFACFTSLLASIKGKLWRVVTGLVLLMAVFALHAMYAQLSIAGLFEVIGTKEFAEIFGRVMGY